MSSYIVEPVTINRILSYVMTDGECLCILQNAGFYLNYESSKEKRQEQLQKLGEILLKMNVEAVAQIYGKGTTKMNNLKEYKYEECGDILNNKEQVLKSVDCFLYQCFEGDVPKKKLYKALQKIRVVVAIDIIENSKKYQKAKWE